MREPIVAGLRACRRHWLLAAWLYLTSSILSVPAALAVGYLVHRQVGATLSAADFADGTFLLVCQFLAANITTLTSMLPWMVGLGLLWLVVHLFWRGALIENVLLDASPSLGELAASGAHNWPRLARLLPAGMLCLLVAGCLPIYALFKMVQSVSKSWYSEPAVLAANLGVAALGFLLIAFASGAHDLMRAHAVLADEARAPAAFYQGLRIAVRSPLRLLVACVPFVFSTLVLTIFVAHVCRYVAHSGWLAFCVVIGVQQAAAFLRAMLSVGLVGAEASLWGAARGR